MLENPLENHSADGSGTYRRPVGVVEGESVLLRMKQAFTIFVYPLMVAVILALWREDAPHFIYVAF